MPDGTDHRSRDELFAKVMELERLKTDFVARVSHELRTPITIITGFLDTLLARDGDLEPAQRQDMLERARGAAGRLGWLIEELLILSRLEVGVLTPTREPVDLAGLFDRVRAASTDPGLVVVAWSAGATVVTDPDLLSRAVGLVVDNAVKHGGTAELGAAADGEAWVIEIRDRGPGFAADIKDTAFEMFTRGRGTTAVPGLGVGLSIARTLVEVLGGRIELVDPADGAGALVRIGLPRGGPASTSM